MSNTTDTKTLVVSPTKVTPRSLVNAFGTTKFASEWAKIPICMVSEQVLIGRLSLGWPPEIAIIAPLHTHIRQKGSKSGQLRSERVEILMQTAWVAWRNWGDGDNAPKCEATGAQTTPKLLDSTAVIAEEYAFKCANEDATRWLEDNAIQAVSDIAASGLPDATPMLLELRVHSLPYLFN